MHAYDLMERIAGNTHTVYKARHHQTGEVVAIKVMTEGAASNPALVKRFEKEYNAGKLLNHPNLVRALEFGIAGETPYLVMELVDGESLDTRLDRDGAVSECDAVKLIVQVAQGLHEVHKKGMIHRDVKPENILVTFGGVAKLTGFGLAVEVDAPAQERIGRGLGAPHFMSPEQIKGENVDVRSDIYSLGCTMYVIVTGQKPFASAGPLAAYTKKLGNDLTPPRHFVPALSEHINSAICRALSADPEPRPASCLEFAERLQ
jgi:serine/threonine protein kinase